MPLPIGLSMYSFNTLLRPDAAEQQRSASRVNAWTWKDLASFAAREQLNSVELSYELFAEDRAALDTAKGMFAELGLNCVLDMGLPQRDKVARALRVAHDLGVRTLRVVLSHILCGERRTMNGGWRAHRDAMTAELRSTAALARDVGVVVAIENHQDLTSEELVAVCEEVGSHTCGVCLDVPNPLAVVEDMDAFARRVGPYVRNVHCKDYRLHATPQGYRLQRCAFGQGIVDWRHVWELLGEIAPNATRHIELGAVHNRHVKFLEDSFWPDYPPRSARDLLPVLRLRENAARPIGESWTTPHERGESIDVCRQFEIDELMMSLDHLRNTVLKEQ